MIPQRGNAAFAVEPPAIARASISESFYSPELDTLRFFAFLGVFFFHVAPRNIEQFATAGLAAPWLLALFSSGAYGVDLFFALSAYLITNLLLREKEMRGALDVKRFYIRRILRIWPLYFVFIAFATALQFATKTQHLSLGYVIGYLLLAGNWAYSAWGVPISAAVPLWSVSIEEQFYLLWPLAVRKNKRCVMALIAFGLLIMANIARALLVMMDAPEPAIEYNTLTRLDPIALGILLVLAARGSLAKLHFWARVALFTAGSCAWIVCGRYCEFNTDHVNALGTMIGRPVVALASIAILCAFVGTRSRLLKHPALLYLGKISYGLYVFHFFTLAVAHRLIVKELHLDIYPFVAFGLLLTVALSAFSYRFLEGPFLLLKERFTYVASRPV